EVFSIADDDEADLFALQKFFDHQTRPQRVDGSISFVAIVRNDHAFAGGEAVSLDHDGKFERIERRDAGFGGLDTLEPSGRDSDAAHEFFRMNLARFELRVLAVGTN